MSRFKWYRKLRGGYWVNTSINGISWVKLPEYRYNYWVSSWPNYKATHMEDWT